MTERGEVLEGAVAEEGQRSIRRIALHHYCTKSLLVPHAPLEPMARALEPMARALEPMARALEPIMMHTCISVALHHCCASLSCPKP